MGASQSTIEIGYRDGVILIRIKGKGIFWDCQFLKRHINEILNQGYKYVIVDSKECEYMDSTFWVL